jgi:hypothetical protein
MRFVQMRKIPDCLPLAFEEAIELEADLIVLQSPALEDVFYELLRERGKVTDINEFTGTVLWTGSGRKTVVLTVRHPSSYRFRGPWQTVWDREVAPKLAVVRRLLDEDAVEGQ